MEGYEGVEGGVGAGPSTTSTSGAAYYLGRSKKNSFWVNGREYQEEQLISEGGYGYVYKVTLKSSKSGGNTSSSQIQNGRGASPFPPNTQFALKRMIIQDEEMVPKVQKEAEIWKRVGKHRNVVEYVDSELVYRFDAKRNVQVIEMLIVCSLCQGGFTLIDMIEQCNGQIPEHVILTIMGDICAGVAHMHHLGISHRDLKVENILLSDHQFKVADFGSAETSDNFLYWHKLEGME